MKKVKALMALCGAVLWIAGCPVPMGDNLLIERDSNSIVTYVTDYNLQTYIPIPKTGEAPVSSVNRGDLDVSVIWKDSAGVDLPSLPVFQANTVYKAEIKLIPRSGYGFNPSIPFGYHLGKISAQVDDLGDPARTVAVTYNNSDDADITFIIDYNLQSYVPVPIAGERPVRAVTTREDLAVTAAWEREDSPGSDTFAPIDTADSFTFELGAVYRAALELTAKPGYRFYETKNFTYTDGSQAVPVGSGNDPGTREFTVVYSATRAPRVITDNNLTTYVPKPVSGTTPVGSFAASQYTGTVSWKNTLTQTVLAGPFEYGTAYTAELVLTPASGYTINSIGQDAFVHTGAETITNPAGGGAVTITFPPTSNAPSPTVVYDTILTSYIAKPMNRTTPVTSFSGSQYHGTVVWKNRRTQAALIGQFQTNEEYMAVVTLTALPGYTFTGIGQNVFVHDDASGSVINPRNSGIVTINFPPADSFFLQALSFGPVGAEGSALKIMKERKDDNNPVIIELPGVEEVVIPNTAELLADYNCPVNITIDGRGQVLEIEGKGILLSVKAGITLTLKNITLQGMADNNSPLVIVQAGGTLVLGDGVTITGNTTTAKVGGIWVNGGELVMNSGATLSYLSSHYDFDGYASSSCGGVFVNNNGIFTMFDGIIEHCSGGGTNIECGGGVLIGEVVIGGIFNMYGGTIRNNTAEKGGGGLSSGAAGVYAVAGTFNMYGGSITGNIATGDNLHGGVGGYVYLDGTGTGTITDNLINGLPDANWP